jgi:predicted nucleotidyltransferase
MIVKEVDFNRLGISAAALAGFCARWKIARLSVFGSVLRSDFNSDSDIDVLVALRDDAQWSLWDWIEMKSQLGELVGRPVDVIEESGLKNPFRRREILKTCQVLYAETVD